MNSTIACLHCGELNRRDATVCRKCHTATPVPDDATTFSGEFANPSSADAPTPAPVMGRGTVLASGRYQITGILGQGGMGAVYKAKDRELDRFVAIKVIQPEYVESKAVLMRFKQELILARQVTH